MLYAEEAPVVRNAVGCTFGGGTMVLCRLSVRRKAVEGRMVAQSSGAWTGLSCFGDEHIVYM